MEATQRAKAFFASLSRETRRTGTAEGVDTVQAGAAIGACFLPAVVNVDAAIGAREAGWADTRLAS